MRCLLFCVLLMAGCMSRIPSPDALETWIWTFNPDRPYPPAAPPNSDTEAKLAERAQSTAIFFQKNGVLFSFEAGHAIHVSANGGNPFLTTQRYRYDVTVRQRTDNLSKIKKLLDRYQPIITRKAAEPTQPDKAR